MRQAFSAAWHAVSVAIGLAVFAALMWWIARSHSHMWRRVAARYGGKRRDPLARKVPETIVIAGRIPGVGDYRQYAGASVGIHRNGLSLSLVPPLNLMCSPLFLPFDRMELASTYWAMWPEPMAIRMAGLPDIDIIVGNDTVRWLREHSGAAPFRMDR